VSSPSLVPVKLPQLSGRLKSRSREVNLVPSMVYFSRHSTFAGDASRGTLADATDDIPTGAGWRSLQYAKADLLGRYTNAHSVPAMAPALLRFPLRPVAP
jgi:hypothetical protein